MGKASCKLKLCGCFGKAMDNMPTEANYLRGVESGLLGILEDIQPQQEQGFFDMLDNIVRASSVQNKEKFNASMAKLFDFGMKISS